MADTQTVQSGHLGNENGPWTKYRRGPWTKYQQAPGWQDRAIRLDPPQPAKTGTWQDRAVRLDPPGTTPPVDEAQRLYDLDREYEASVMTPPPLDGSIPARMAMPEGYAERNRVTGPRPSVTDEAVRGLRVGTQGVGAGLAGVAGLPVDLAELALNTGAYGVDKLVQALGGEMPHRFSGSIGGTDSIRDAAAQIVEAFLGDGAIIAPGDMTPSERSAHTINRFGTEGALSSGLVSAGRGLLPRTLTAPYEASGSASRVYAGDAAAGIGSGAMLAAYEENVPDPVKERMGPLGTILAGLFGGVGGAKLADIGEATARAGARAADPRRHMPESVIPRDPVTMMPVGRRDFANAAELFRGGFRSADDFETAKANITAYLSGVGDSGPVGPGPHPTTALIMNDPANLAVERRHRARDSAPFIAADRAVMDDVSAKLAGVRPENGDPATAIRHAERLGAQSRDAARRDVVSARTALTEHDRSVQEVAAALGARSADAASRELDRAIVDETYLPLRAGKNRLYDDAARDPGIAVPTSSAQRYADMMLERNLGLSPSLRDPRSTRIAEDFGTSENLRPERPLAEAMRDRQALSTVQAEARAKGDFGLADTASALRKGINEDIRSAAESGAQGTEALRSADTNYRERFAPYFREGYAAPDFFRSIDRDPTRAATPREMTAGKFLTAGPTSRAAAADIAKILEIAPSRDSAVAAARDYLIADAVGKGIIRDGQVSETALARFIAQREGALQAIPELGASFADLLERVRSGSAQGSRLKAALADAEHRAQLTEREVNQGALGLLIDHEPRKAVAAVFANANPPQRMRELRQRFDGNPQAIEGWKAAVSDYLYRQATTASKAAVSDGFDTASLAATRRLFEDNQAALAEVFDPDEMQALQQAQRRLEILSRRGTQANVGSATAEIQAGGLQRIIEAFAEPLGTVTTFTKGALMGGSYARRTRLIAEQFPDANAAARTILDRVRFDPVLAKHLMEFPTNEAQIYTWSKQLNKLLVLGGASGE